jgi:hypothetical protein
VDPSGIITTIAGTGVSGYSGDGGSPLLAQFNGPTGLALDTSNNIYVADMGNGLIRKFNNLPSYVSDSFNVLFTSSCTGNSFNLSTRHYVAGMSFVTHFGDGQTNTSTVIPGTFGAVGYSTFSHSYANSGTYTIKHVLKYWFSCCRFHKLYLRL